MTMTINRRTALGLLALAPAAARGAGLRELTVFEARRFITMEPGRPSCRYVAVADGMIVALGDTLAELEPWTAGRNVKIDRSLAEQVVLPGLIDPHLHPVQAAVMLNIPFIAPDDWKLPSGTSPGVRTAAGYRQRLTQAIAASSDDPFITWGWHELFHGPLSRADLDAMAPGRAVVVWQRSFHEILSSTAMLERWGIKSADDFAAVLGAVKADPAHGDYARGLFTETGLQAALIKLRPLILGPARIVKGMAALQQMMRQNGVTTAADMATGVFADFATEAGLIKAAFERSDAAARMMLVPIATRLDAEADLDGWLAKATRDFAGAHVRLDRRVKMLADGAFFSLNMRMNAPGYIDGHEGRWLTEPAVISRQFARFWQAGFSLHIHVNGDEGLDRVLEGLEPLGPRGGQTITLEHLGYSTEAQNRRIARMGLMVSAQPNYIRVLGDVYSHEGLGPGRAEQINRLGSLERLGVPLGLHSDFNMAPVDPLYLAWIAANRITLDGHVMAPAERLSLDKALRAITIEAAQVIGMDAIAGSIAVGKKADFAALDRDPYVVGAKGLNTIKVAGVVYEGRYTPA
ncbi:MAG: amidohydrolase family protein [Novosphingobium sp.]|uniref:amidohydrolase n=1 Tax=Novosphingobium sp. TaxID=1874826 RepID=UPI003C7EA838